MKPSIKKLWITALLSGKYRQGKDCLKKDGNFCCLGVLSDLYAKEHNIKWKKELFENPTLFNEGEVLPSMVMKWAGLTRKNPKVNLTDETRKKIGNTWLQRDELSSLNDNGCNFKVIAECIKQSL